MWGSKLRFIVACPCCHMLNSENDLNNHYDGYSKYSMNKNTQYKDALVMCMENNISLY